MLYVEHLARMRPVVVAAVVAGLSVGAVIGWLLRGML